MKQIASIFLLLAFSAQTFSQGLILANYYFNTEAFAKLCVNKARPTLHCNGKCQMMKEMKKQENREQQNGEPKLTNKSDTPSSKSFFASLSIQALLPSEHISVYLSILLPRGNRTDVFHPPGLV